MITCSVCGCLNDSSRATCRECGSDLSDSPDWGVDYDDDDLNYDDTDDLIVFDEDESDDDDLNFDDSEELGYFDDEYYD